MAPLEPWEKVIVDFDAFGATTHGKQSCTDCHGGVSSADKETAHTGMIAAPSSMPDKYCAECHEKEAAAYPNSLHATQQGYWTAINARSVPEDHPAMEGMFNNHCATCHTTCGECHVAQPENVGGGLFSGHVFEKTPPMTRACTACHGSRVGNEYLGKNEGIPGDVHFREGRMNCIKCHAGADLHGEGLTEMQDNRYAGVETPACVNCHPTAVPGGDENPMHQAHGEDTLSCQVCHSVTYTSCDSCHVAVSEKSGNPYFETSATYSTFLIGRNPIQTEDRPYRYVPVRHVPVDPESYAYYGDNLLSNFNAASTWVYSTPHNIQLNTPQNASCDQCHSSESTYFLTADKVRPEEAEANTSVIVGALPFSLEKAANAPFQPADHQDHVSNSCTACHATGIRNAPVYPEDHAAYQNENCIGCHKLQK